MQEEGSPPPEQRRVVHAVRDHAPGPGPEARCVRIHPAVAAYFGNSGKLWRLLGVRADPAETAPVVRRPTRAGRAARSVQQRRARKARRHMQRASRQRNRR